MKTKIALFALSWQSWTLAAPVLMLLQHTPPASSAIATSKVPEATRLRIPANLDNSESQKVLGSRPDNQPYAPPEDVTPSEALAAQRPLQTTYLLSLKGKESLGRMKTTQPDLSDSSIVREETGVTTDDSQRSIVDLETDTTRPPYHGLPCGIYFERLHRVKPYTDVVVVRMVFVLIAAFALFELWSPVRRRVRRAWRGEGSIRLEEGPDEMEQSSRQHPKFSLRPAVRKAESNAAYAGEQATEL